MPVRILLGLFLATSALAADPPKPVTPLDLDKVAVEALRTSTTAGRTCTTRRTRPPPRSCTRVRSAPCPHSSPTARRRRR